MTKTAKSAPTVFARTSKTSALLVVVNKPCNISIVIPKAKENTTEYSKDLNIVPVCNCLLKNKNQTKVNTK